MCSTAAAIRGRFSIVRVSTGPRAVQLRHDRRNHRSEQPREYEQENDGHHPDRHRRESPRRVNNATTGSSPSANTSASTIRISTDTTCATARTRR